MPSDPLPRLPLPDPLLARKALSEVRNVVRAGFGLVRELIDQAPLPTPVAAVAGTVLRRVDHLAQHADAAASTMVHGFLTAAGIAVDDRDTPHAAALCAGLRGALEELGGTELRVSESGVREALRRRDGDARALSEDARAAALMVRLLEAGAVRPIAPQASDRLTGPAAMIPVAIFAAVLAELQEQAADPAGIAASADLADALAVEIRGAGSDGAALARLFAEFRNHV